VSGFDGGEYQRRFDALAAGGMDVHGEATFVRSLLVDPAPATVLDAGCGTGRVAIELARHGITTLGVDADPSMIAEARRRAPALEWLEANLTELSTALRPEARFTVVVLAGNVPLFTPPGTQDALVTGCGARVAPGGALVAGFQLGRGYELAAYDASCASTGLELEDRYATWDRRPFRAGDYAVSVHRRP
jgi:2-polyprenyl-3-methyl-5-hydroxy-6-metoxy-1,4-benzoquinol methylase